MARKAKSKYTPDPARQQARKVAKLRKVLKKRPYCRSTYGALTRLGVEVPPLAPLPSQLRASHGITLTKLKRERRLAA